MAKGEEIKSEDTFHKYSVLTPLPPKGEFTFSEVTNKKVMRQFDLNKKVEHVVECDNEFVVGDRLKFRTMRENFETDRNPVYAIEAFLESMEMGFYPPMWVLTFMRGKFEKFWKIEGKESLGEIFGFKGGTERKYGDKKFSKVELELRNDHIGIAAFQLITIFRMKPEIAFHAVASRIEKEMGKNVVKYEQIRKIYYRWKKNSAIGTWEATALLKKWNVNELRRLLELYPYFKEEGLGDHYLIKARKIHDVD